MFKLSDVFNVQMVKKLTMPGKPYVMDKDIISENGIYPYLAAISRNNGITGYSIFKPNNKGDCITLSTTADSPNTLFYQKDDFIGRQQIAEFRRKDGKAIGECLGMYLVSVIRKLVKNFNYTNKLTVDFLKESCVMLSVQTDASGTPIIDSTHKYHKEGYLPDFEYMEKYIRAIEKLVIKDVVCFKDNMIKKTKELCKAQKGDTDGEAA